MADENLYDLSEDLEGTTAIAFFHEFFHEQIIKLAVDSRESNEGATKREPGWKAKVFNTAVKWYPISSKIIAVMVGLKMPNFKLRTQVLNWAKVMKKSRREIKVSDTAGVIETYMEGLSDEPDMVYKFGTIVAGYDTFKGLQIYRVIILGKEVENQEVHMLASLGTGAAYAINRMIHEAG